MAPIRRLAGTLLALIAIPAITGCAALGLPELSAADVLPLAADAASTSADPGATPAPQPTPGYFASSDGYSLTLPAGWGAADVSGLDSRSLAGSVGSLDPTLGALAQLGLDSTGARLSFIGVDLVASAASDYAPSIVVATMRTRGMPKDAARSAVESILGQAPVVGEIAHRVETHAAGDVHRYDVVLQGATVAVRLQAYVFRVGGDSFVVGVIAPVESFASAEPAFDEIVKSLRFGV